MKIWQAIQFVLNKSERPLTAKEIYDTIALSKLYKFNTLNPVHIVSNEVRRRCINLEIKNSRSERIFLRTTDGRYTNFKSTPTLLRSSSLLKDDNECSLAEKKLTKAYAQYISAFSELLLEELKAITPEQFEIFSMNFLKSYGFTDLQVTCKGKDGGIDGFGTLNVGICNLNVAFQCKRWRNTKINSKTVTQFLGSISGMQNDGNFIAQGYFFTTAEFTQEAKQIAMRKGTIPIVLIDGKSIVKSMLDKQIGIAASPLFTYSVDIDDMINNIN